MDSNLYISALQRQPCLLKTNSTRVLVTWLITLRLIICPSSYKARPNNLIGKTSFRSGIISPQWSDARLNFPTSNVVGGAKFGLVSRLQATPSAMATYNYSFQMYLPRAAFLKSMVFSGGIRY